MPDVILTRCLKCDRFHDGPCTLKWGRRGFLAMLAAAPAAMSVDPTSSRYGAGQSVAHDLDWNFFESIGDTVKLTGILSDVEIRRWIDSGCGQLPFQWDRASRVDYSPPWSSLHQLTFVGKDSV